MVKTHILLFVLAIAVAKAENYHWKYMIKGRLPANAYKFHKNDTIAVIYIKNDLLAGKLPYGDDEITTVRNSIPKGNGLQVLCVTPNAKLVWLPTSTDTFRTDIIGTCPVKGGYHNNRHLFVGRAWDEVNKDYKIGNIYKRTLHTAKGFENKFEILLEDY